MRPSDPQLAVLALAADAGYVRPSSATHAKRCGGTPGRLTVTARACVKHGWLTGASGGRYVLTDAGRALVPTTGGPPAATGNTDAGDGGWAF
jgi:hypothetical protein